MDPVPSHSKQAEDMQAILDRLVTLETLTSNQMNKLKGLIQSHKDLLKLTPEAIGQIIVDGKKEKPQTEELQARYEFACRIYKFIRPLLKDIKEKGTQVGKLTQKVDASKHAYQRLQETLIHTQKSHEVEVRKLQDQLDASQRALAEAQEEIARLRATSLQDKTG